VVGISFAALHHRAANIQCDAGLADFAVILIIILIITATVGCLIIWRRKQQGRRLSQGILVMIAIPTFITLLAPPDFL